jgi:isopropylmalate/homocitrate/citramalate synthase
MAGAEEVGAGIDPRGGTISAGLVVNEKGYERLAATALGEVHFSLGVTETFNRRNANASVDESVAAARRISERVHTEGRRLVVSLRVAFGCPFEGEVGPAHVLELAKRIVAFAPLAGQVS